MAGFFQSIYDWLLRLFWYVRFILRTVMLPRLSSVHHSSPRLRSLHLEWLLPPGPLITHLALRESSSAVNGISENASWCQSDPSKFLR